MKPYLHGIYTPFAVPTTESGNIAENELRRYLRWLIEKGVNGLYSNGSTGEFIRFTLEERRRITQIATEEALDRVPVLAGVAENTLSEVIESCELYRDMGCLAVSLCPPYYFRMRQEAIQSYFQEVARHSSLPVVLYHIPSFTNALSAEVILALSEEPNIVGIKDSGRDFIGFTRLMQDLRRNRSEFACLIGTEELLLPAMFMGADGGAIASSGIVPEAILSLIQAFNQMEVENAKKIQYALLPLIGKMFGPDFPAGFRAGAAARGFSMGLGRQPLSNHQIEELTMLVPQLKNDIDRLLQTI